jgi:hypothetical protein
MMKKPVALAAAVGGVLVVGLAFGGLAIVFQAKAAKDEGVITLSKKADGTCAATTDPPKMEGMRNKHVKWDIYDPSACLPDGAEVEVRFGATVFWFSSKAKNRTEIKKLIQPFARTGPPPYKYEVWKVGGTGGDYRMEDPELEIIQ